MERLSKSRLLASLQCPKRLWLQAFRPELAEDDSAARARLATGTHVGEVARILYPDGVLVEGEDLSRALHDTQALLAESPRPLFEATFQAEDVLVRTDLLLPDQGAYRLAEVKSSTRVKDDHLPDVAVQAWVLKRAGVKISRTELVHINNAFVYPGDGNYQGLFTHDDVTERISPLEESVPDWIATARQTLSGGEPAIQPGGHCHAPFECPFLRYCTPAAKGEPGFPPEILPRADGKRTAEELRGEGYDDLRRVPEARLTDPLHRRIRQATIDGRPYLAAEAGDVLRGLSYPRYYLDFETIHFAVPIWAGTRPYQQIPFQWSCHIETRDGCIEHREFLADVPGDPRRAFAESLIHLLGKEGSILVYNAPFEQTRMQELADAFPGLAPALKAAIQRITDLLPIAREHYYHPELRGSWSIKAVLPTLAPELAYDALEVGNGGMAMDAYAEMLRPQTGAERRDHLRHALLEYCRRDSWALVRLAHYFQNPT